MIDIGGEIAGRTGRVIIEFEGSMDADRLVRNRWFIRSVDDSRMFVIPRLRKNSSTTTTFEAHVGAGKYFIEPRSGFLNVATFSPIELVVTAGKEHHVVVPAWEDRSVDTLIQVLDSNGALDPNPSRVKLQKSSGHGSSGYGPTITTTLTGEAKHTLLEGAYAVQFFVNGVASEPILITAKAGQETRIVYQRPVE